MCSWLMYLVSVFCTMSYLMWRSWEIRNSRTRSDRPCANCGTFLLWCRRIRGRPYCRARAAPRCQPTTDPRRRRFRKLQRTWSMCRWWRSQSGQPRCARAAARSARGRRCTTAGRGRVRAACSATPDRRPIGFERLGTSGLSTRMRKQFVNFIMNNNLYIFVLLNDKSTLSINN